MWKAVLPVFGVALAASVATILVLTLGFHLKLFPGAGSIIGIAWVLAMFPWLFKRMNAAFDRGEL